jgi:hypothetical protein
MRGHFFSVGARKRSIEKFAQMGAAEVAKFHEEMTLDIALTSKRPS